MKKIALLTLAIVALGLTGCRQQGGPSDEYNTEMGSSTNTAPQRSSTNAITPSPSAP